MQSALTTQIAESPRAKLFWAAIAVLLVGQTVAIYMLCSNQVRQAQSRDAAIKVQRVAIADCLQYVANSTIGSCAGQVAQLNPDGSIPRSTSVASNAHNSSGLGTGRSPISAMPVSFNYR